MASTPVVSLSLTASLPTGGLQITLYPASHAVGWVSSGNPYNHFGERNLHVGVFEGNTYYGAMQFSLASIPPDQRLSRRAWSWSD